LNELDTEGTLLVVDDEMENLHFMHQFLTDAGYRVLEAPDGLAAWQVLMKNPVDLVITDILMPRLDGLSLCQQIRNDPRTAHLPVLMLTARFQIEEKLNGFSAGADDYLAKPFDVLELQARIESLLERSRRDLWLHPLSRLPGSPGIEAEVKRLMDLGELFSLAYLDLDHFKAFNDTYGYLAGDEILKFLAQLLSDVVSRTEDPRPFAGHIGGDDFVLIGTPERMPDMLAAIFDRFDAAVAAFYSPTDQAVGGIRCKNREGEEQYFPFVRLSAGVVDTTSQPFVNYSQIAAVASELKHHAKELAHPTHSLCLWNRRSAVTPSILA
jgi:diguanylate cyclase (GGDEF)-like protein